MFCNIVTWWQGYKPFLCYSQFRRISQTVCYLGNISTQSHNKFLEHRQFICFVSQTISGFGKIFFHVNKMANLHESSVSASCVLECTHHTFNIKLNEKGINTLAYFVRMLSCNDLTSILSIHSHETFSTTLKALMLSPSYSQTTWSLHPSTTAWHFK